MTVRDRVQWGPILAGLLSAIATLIVMTVLGIALGASVLDQDASGGEIGMWAGVWGAISLIFSFFVGGWVAAKTAAVGGPFAGLMNGFTVGAAALTLILWLTATGVGNLFGAVSQNLGDILNVAQDQAQQQAQEAQGQTQQATAKAEQTARGAFDEVRDGAWGTLGRLLLALGAATLGGYLGHNKRRKLIEGKHTRASPRRAASRGRPEQSRLRSNPCADVTSSPGVLGAHGEGGGPLPRTNRTGRRRPPPRRLTPRPALPTGPIEFDALSEWEVLTPDGRYLGRVALSELGERTFVLTGNEVSTGPTIPVLWGRRSDQW